jgi:acyl-CoA reductase-like NAD-dependent aldehyde dehydrogenase
MSRERRCHDPGGEPSGSTERAFHLPGGKEVRSRSVAFGRQRLTVAEPSADEMRALLAELRDRAGRGEFVDRAAHVAGAAGRFLRPDDPLRRRALEAIPGLTGFSPAMIEEGLARVFAALADAEALEETARTAARAFGLVGIIAAGNIPGVALFKTALALTAGAACFVKTAAGEPLLTVLFAEALDAIDPCLASALAVSWWEGGSGGCEEALLCDVDSLVAYGSDATVAALAARRRGPFVGFAHRLSISVIRLDREADERSLAAAAAVDVALHDQLGCLSPQSLYLVGAESSRRRKFVDRLAEALDEAEARWPSGWVGEDAAVTIRRLRDEYEWRDLGGEDVLVRAGREWTVLADPTPGFRPNPLHRTIFVRPLESIGALRVALGERLPRVECVGVGPWPDAETSAALAALGIPRIAPLGSMQSPGVDWRQGGRDPMTGIAAVAGEPT